MVALEPGMQDKTVQTGPYMPTMAWEHIANERCLMFHKQTDGRYYLVVENFDGEIEFVTVYYTGGGWIRQTIE